MSSVFLNENIQHLITLALCEDCVSDDVTTRCALVDPNISARGVMYAKDNFTLCGLPILSEIIKLSRVNVTYQSDVEDGETVNKGDALAVFNGRVVDLLALERTFLNFIQRLSSVATTTAEYVALAKPMRVFDTRKTTPGWRLLEKYAVKTGGGENHRMNLSDMILIKNNHIDVSVCSMDVLLSRVFKEKSPDIPVQVEVRNIEELRVALAFPIDRIMLDNMSNTDIAKGLDLIDTDKILVEVSGNVDKERIPILHELGVPAISTSKLITSQRAVDISLRIEV